ncbi:MAG: YciI family protein, partial [Myxococcota bacterium]
LAEYMDFSQRTKAAGQFLGGEPLEPVSTSTTVRVRDGQTITTDGPFAETKEQLGGFYMIEAKDQTEAVALAARLPAARYGSVEVRPIMELDLEALLAEG